MSRTKNIKRQKARKNLPKEDRIKRNKRRRGVKNWWKDVDLVEETQATSS